MEEFRLSKAQAETVMVLPLSEKRPYQSGSPFTGLTRTEVLRLCSALRSKGIKCRIMPVPVGEQGDTQLR